MTTILEYIQGSDLGDAALTVKENGTVLDLSTGHTFALKVGTPGSAALLTKSTGITGAATSPNVTIAWATTGELNTLPPGIYDADLIITRTADSKDRKRRFQLRVDPAIT